MKKRDFEEIKTILKNARECGCPTVIIDGVKYELAAAEEAPKPKDVPEVDPEDLVKPISVLDDLTNEELLYWATPYFDQLQEQKRIHQEAIKSGVDNG